MIAIDANVMFVGAPGADEVELVYEFAGICLSPSQPERIRPDKNYIVSAEGRAIRDEVESLVAEFPESQGVTNISYTTHVLADKNVRVKYTLLQVAGLDIARAARYGDLSAMVYAYDARSSRSLEALCVSLAAAAYVPADVHVLVGTHAGELGAERTVRASAALAASRSFGMHVRLGEGDASIEDLRRGITEKLLLARTAALVAHDQRASRGLLAPLRDWFAWATSP